MTEPKPSLLEVMKAESIDRYRRSGWSEWPTYAAEIEALADWLVPEEPRVVSDSAPDCPIWAAWNERHKIRLALLAEAERARHTQI